MRIYIDTSVINGLYSQDSTIQSITQEFFKLVRFGHFTIYGSEVVAGEIRKTPDTKLRQLLIEVLEEYQVETLPISEEVKILAEHYVRKKVIPVKYVADALHIAMATIHNIPVLVSWNFEHIVKHKTRVGVNRINKELGFPQIDICSPQEV